MTPQPRGTGFRALWRDQGGASAAEFSIIGAIMVIAIIGILQVGWALQIRNELGMAADEAVRVVMLDPDADDEAFEAGATDALEDYDADRLVVTAGTTTVGATAFRTLSISYAMTTTVPLVPASAFTLGVSRRTPDL